SVRALQDLLDALLDISRLDSGTEKAQVEPVPVEALFERLEREFAPAAAQKGLALHVRPSPLWVASDARLLYRVLLNLVSNAVRYTAQGGVLVSCRRRGGRALIEVRDTGMGIAAPMHAEVFQEFVQLHNPERDRAKGLGLGLTIVKRTAELLGHELSMTSTPGRGSCFRIEAPLAEPVSMRAEPVAAPPQDLRGLSILVVDDDALAREALVELLQSWGCSVRAAANGAEALAACAGASAPDVLACDFRLPGGEDAIALVGKLRAACGPLPAFLMSGDTDPAVLRAAEAAGLTLLHKPARPAQLRALVYRLVRPAP
ncbi:MAG TPA: hybrid sensor histidine kinase/response regulator, partial [Burkholderiales bacterium]|nr:hybrid sensor histidine kinase/response regulator [Burkholderiales bacterium]